jgi:hypothetical protein
MEEDMHGFENRGLSVPQGRFTDTGRFGRMFPELRSLKTMVPPADVLGGAGPDGGPPGPMEGPGGGVDNPRIKAGYTFLGQFIDHDLTLDATSILEQQIDLNATTNFRTPAFELDSLYGRGPGASPALYDRNCPSCFLLSEDGFDLPRNRQGTAIIGDHRNDENRIIGQLHVLFLKFHNRVMRDFTSDTGGRSRFEDAQTIVRWHYQWIVLNEFLVRTVGRAAVDAVLGSTDRAKVFSPYMPVEFSGAAYRFGHSQIRAFYPINAQGGAAIFPTDPTAPPADNDLRGGRPLPEILRIDWSRFFGVAATRGKLIDTKLAPQLLKLPNGVVPPDTSAADRSLAVRNLKRGVDLRLPAGQTIANFLALPERLPDSEVWTDVPGGAGLAPLWFYILREAEFLHDGQHMGGVGAHIVAQTFVDILLADKASFLWQDRNWTPTLPSAHPGRFTVTDLIKLALGDDAPDIEAEDVDNLPTELPPPAPPSTPTAPPSS